MRQRHSQTLRHRWVPNLVAIDSDTLRQRQDTYLTDHYLTTYVTIASIALGVATVAAASLLATPANHPEFQNYRIMLGVLWLTSLLALGVAYAGPMIGGLLLPARLPAIIDLLIPAVLGICEFALFTVLAYQVTGWSSPKSVLVAWWGSFIAFNCVAVCAITRGRHLVRSANGP
jgi:hypothetical protein